MNKEITIYELLGLIKDGQAPKKILIHDKVYYLLKNGELYVYSQNSHDIRSWEQFLDNKINISQCLNDKVLILETCNEVEIIEEDNKIEKLDNRYYDEVNECYGGKKELGEDILIDKINELIDEVNKLKENNEK